MQYSFHNAALIQLVEFLISNQIVVSSSLTRRSKAFIAQWCSNAPVRRRLQVQIRAGGTNKYRVDYESIS